MFENANTDMTPREPPTYAVASFFAHFEGTFEAKTSAPVRAAEIVCEQQKLRLCARKGSDASLARRPAGARARHGRRGVVQVPSSVPAGAKPYRERTNAWDTARAPLITTAAELRTILDACSVLAVMKERGERVLERNAGFVSEPARIGNCGAATIRATRRDCAWCRCFGVRKGKRRNKNRGEKNNTCPVMIVGFYTPMLHRR